jgi:tetratricopeptide (TPR) repeat protein
MSTRTPVTWSAPVGRYTFEVGAYAGSFAHFAPDSSKTDKAQGRRNAAALRKALAEAGKEQQPVTPLEAVENLEATAEAVTDRVEHANKVFKALAEGQHLDPRFLTGEIGALLSLLDRLDREGRYEEEIRVAKALHGLCVLAFRWFDLIRSLRRALAAADAVGDEAAQAWASNELGALHLCVGNARKASEHLERARGLYEKLGDPAGRCATRHNFDSAQRDVARPLQLKAPRRLLTASGSVRPLVAGVVGAGVLAVLGVAFAPVPAKSDEGTGDLVATIGERPANPSTSSAATFTFSDEGAEGFECKLDHQAFKSCSSPVLYEQLDEGEHTFRVRATAKEEQGPATKYSWRIDLTPPTTTITEKPSRPTAETSADFSFTANEEVKRFECKLDGAPFGECTSPESFAGPLEDGKHTFAARAIDLAGNVGNAEKHQWRISTEQTTVVPDVVGLLSAQGIEALAAAELEGQEETAAALEPVGQIVEQDPAAGEEVPVGTTVTVVISAGIEITVPSVLDQTEESAVTELKLAGFQVSIVPAESNTVPEGSVSAQEPHPGAQAKPGDTVEITVSLGPSVPELS